MGAEREIWLHELGLLKGTRTKGSPGAGFVPRSRKPGVIFKEEERSGEVEQWDCNKASA